MPNRIIKESICRSDSIDGLSWFEEVLFYRLIVSCDDYGRFDGRPAIIKNCLFPLKENLTIKAVADAIKTLASKELVALYEFEGKPYLYLPTWKEHQTTRATKSKYPAPEDGNEYSYDNVKSSENICKQMNTDAPDIRIRNSYSLNDIRNSGDDIRETNAQARETAFDRFWSAYPKKVGKEAARKAFAKVKAPIDVLIAAIEQQKTSRQWTKDNGQYIPNPATWLNQGRWEDEVDVGKKQYTTKGSFFDDD